MEHALGMCPTTYSWWIISLLLVVAVAVLVVAVAVA
jgi:hypothetical protein